MHQDARAICDRCGTKTWLSMLRKEWTGLKVCEHCFDVRHPQDFVRAKGPDRAPYAKRVVGEITYLGVNEVQASDL